VELLLGDPTKAKTNLNWELQVSFKELVSRMVMSDLEKVNQEMTYNVTIQEAATTKNS
jgi:GDPmannose 4,6-dehydratase